MYLDFFDLVVEPFSVTPDPDFLYLTPGYREALAAIVYGVEQRKGFMLLVGEVGTGKTTILRTTLAGLQRRKCRAVYIFNARISFEEIVRKLLREPEATDSLDQMLNRLYQKLIRDYKNGYNFAVIIDEAQNMSVDTMENLRMLSNLETNKNKLVQIVLAGQPELDEKLSRHELRQVKQRIAIRATTSQLKHGQSLEYLHHRLAKAGQEDPNLVFESGATKLIVKHAKGNPRVMNMICDNALIAAYAVQKRPVGKAIVREVIKEFSDSAVPASPVWRYSAVGLAFFAGVAVMGWYQWLPGNVVDPVPRVAQALPAPLPMANPIETSPRPEQHNEISIPVDAGEAKAQDRPAVPALPQVESAWQPAVEITLPQPVAEVEPAVLQQELEATPAPAGGAVLVTAVEVEQAEDTALSEAIGTAAALRASSPAVTLLNESEQFPVIRTVQRGDTMSSLCREVYGAYSTQLVDLVRVNNPQIVNSNVISVGDDILFPAPGELAQTR